MSDFVARVGAENANQQQLFDTFRAHDKAVVAALRAHPLPANWRDLHRLARQLIAEGVNGRIASTFALSGDAVERTLTAFRHVESRAEGAGLASELPTDARCLEAVRDAHSSSGTVPFEDLTDVWSDRLLRAARDATRSQAEAARLLALNVKTYGDKLKKTLKRG